jgi:hypothetical protein
MKPSEFNIFQKRPSCIAEKLCRAPVVSLQQNSTRIENDKLRNNKPWLAAIAGVVSSGHDTEPDCPVIASTPFGLVLSVTGRSERADDT